MGGLCKLNKGKLWLLQGTESQANSILFPILLFISPVKPELIFVFEEIWVVEYRR